MTGKEKDYDALLQELGRVVLHRIRLETREARILARLEELEKTRVGMKLVA